MIIATGGGIVTREENQFPLRQNSVVVYLKRNVDMLSTVNRPLSVNRDAIFKLYENRRVAYETWSDFTVCNEGNVDDLVNEIIEKFNGFFK